MARRRFDFCPSPTRYLYNRMGYWSDWSVPILVTTAAAFTYIAGLLVWVEGLPWAHAPRSMLCGLWGIGIWFYRDP